VKKTDESRSIVQLCQANFYYQIFGFPGFANNRRVKIAKNIKKVRAESLIVSMLEVSMQFSANPKYEQALISTLIHIQTHLQEELLLEDLAGRVGFSPFHFHRVFTEYVGEPVKEYVRRLRLERSAYRLKISGAPIIQIALDAGFKTHESFTRAFKRQFGANPKAFRKDFVRAAEERKQQMRLNYVDQNAFADNSALLPNQATALHVRVERLRPILVAFIRHTGPYESMLEPGSKLISLWESLFKWGAARQLVDDNSLLIGIPQDDPTVTPPEKQRFDVGLQVQEFREPVENIGCQRIGSGLYAIGRHYGSFENLAETYTHIYDTCVTSGKYQLAPAPPFEIYSHSQLSDDLHVHATDVYMAVEPVNGPSKQ
jgi:AraC family transcriptional regulator